MCIYWVENGLVAVEDGRETIWKTEAQGGKMAKSVPKPSFLLKVQCVCHIANKKMSKGLYYLYRSIWKVYHLPSLQKNTYGGLFCVCLCVCVCVRKIESNLKVFASSRIHFNKHMWQSH